jgi:Asp/Glu/hydantoin racemase
MSKYSILWQSSTAIKGFPAYEKAILEHADRILSSEFKISVRGVQNGTSDLHFMSFDFLNNSNVFDSVIRAEKEGFDAVAIGCFLDPILDELREIVDIPVLSLGEAGMLTAGMLGKYFSVISYVPQNNNKIYRELPHKYALSGRTVKFASFDLPLTELEKGFIDAKPVLERFEKAGKEAVNNGAEVLLPGCGCLNLIIVKGGMTQIEGATVLDVSGALMKMTEMMIILKEVSGTKISRKGYYEAPSREQIENTLKIYGKI